MQGLKSVEVVHVAKDLSASFLLLLMCVSQRPLSQNAHVLRNYSFHCLLVLLEINMNTWLG